MPSFNLGPPQVDDWWWNFGYAEALRRGHRAAALNTTNAIFYSAVIAALNAIGGVRVPAVPANCLRDRL